MRFSISNLGTHVPILSTLVELYYGRFVDPIVLGAARHVHSDLRIYRISFFLLGGFQLHRNVAGVF